MRFGLACPNSNFDHRLSLKVREKAARPVRGVMVWPGRPGDKKYAAFVGATTTNTRQYRVNAGSSPVSAEWTEKGPRNAHSCSTGCAAN
jgi:hypothetical protein